jgi:predicted Zn-dependent protease with MMP-like domain
VVEIAPDRFEQLVADALDGLPERLGRLMRNVAVTVEDDSRQPGLLGLYQGVPLTERGDTYAGVLPDRITIYRQPICARAQTEAEVVDQVRVTVVHEVAHHFGMHDDRLRDLGWG